MKFIEDLDGIDMECKCVEAQALWCKLKGYDGTAEALLDIAKDMEPAFDPQELMEWRERPGRRALDDAPN